MNHLRIFLPCAAGVEDLLAAEASRITGQAPQALGRLRGGVALQAAWRDVLLLNLHSRLAQRVLVQLGHAEYRDEQDLYAMASGISWEAWFTPRNSFKIEITAQHSPLRSLNFATLRVKDAVADRFRAKSGVRPDVQTRWPDVRLHLHLSATHQTLYIDTSGEALFKRGWRTDKGDAPLKETLAAAMIAASGWDGQSPLYDPCCGSGTIAIEAAQIACRMAPGQLRRFGFEKLLPFQSHVWLAMKSEAKNGVITAETLVFGSDVAHRMVDFAQRNAERAGVAAALQLRGGDALQRMPPTDRPGTLLLNPPYGERIAAAGFAGGRSGRERVMLQAADVLRRSDAPSRNGPGAAGSGDAEQDTFFQMLGNHWKRHFTGWTAWVLTPDMGLPGRLRLKESRRVPMWNGPIECRMFRFDLTGPISRPGRGAPASVA